MQKMEKREPVLQTRQNERTPAFGMQEMRKRSFPQILRAEQSKSAGNCPQAVRAKTKIATLAAVSPPARAQG